MNEGNVEDLVALYVRRRAGNPPIGLEEFAAQYPALKSQIIRFASEIEEMEDVVRCLRGPDAIAAEAPRSAIPSGSGRFEIRDEIGSGAFGSVFRAFDQVLGREVALKFIKTPPLAPEGMLVPFLQEAKALASVSHENVVTLHDVGELDGKAFLCMELLKGQTLRSRLKLGPVAPHQAVAIALDVCRGARAIHQAGLIHRDVKPANVFLGPLEHAKILDFGVGLFGATEKRLPAGTPQYMSPEQAAGGPIDQRSDLYAIGLLLFEMLTGKKPFKTNDIPQSPECVVREDPPDVRSVCPELSVKLAAVVRRALEKDPARRFSSASDLEAALREVPEWGKARPKALVRLASAALVAAALIMSVLLLRGEPVPRDEVSLIKLSAGSWLPCESGSTVSGEDQLAFQLRAGGATFLYAVYVSPDKSVWCLFPHPTNERPDLVNPLPVQSRWVPPPRDERMEGWSFPDKGEMRLWVVTSREPVPGLAAVLGNLGREDGDLATFESGGEVEAATRTLEACVTYLVQEQERTRGTGPVLGPAIPLREKGPLSEAYQAFRELGRAPSRSFHEFMLHSQ